MMASKLPVVSGKQVVKAFTKLGYTVIRRKSSHIRMGHDEKKKITIPDHKILGKGMLRKLIRDAEITIEEFNKAIE